MYIVILTALWLMGNMSKQKEEIQFLYDRLRKNHYELNEARSRLVEYAQRVEDVAQIEERNRISKEIHDQLGHQLIRIKMMAEALIRILPQNQEKEWSCCTRSVITDGLSNKEISERLYLSEGTVKNYVTQILQKLNLRDRTQIAIYYLKNIM